MHCRAILNAMETHVQGRAQGEMLRESDRRFLECLFVKPCPKFFIMTYDRSKGKITDRQATTREWKALIRLLVDTKNTFCEKFKVNEATIVDSINKGQRGSYAINTDLGAARPV